MLPEKRPIPSRASRGCLIPAQIQDAAKRTAIKDFLAWMITPGRSSVSRLAYAQLPKEVVAKEQKAIAMIQ